MPQPLAPARSILFRYLTEGFSAPDSNRLAYLEEMVDTIQAASREMTDSGEANDGFALITRLATAVAEAGALPIGVLQAEFTRLFVQGIPTTPCRLVESVQREGALVGEAAEDAASMYLRFGLEVRDREPDHLTAELEFLTYLTGTPIAAGKETERYHRAALRFEQDHLLRWGPDVVSKIRQNTSVPLYLALADLFDWVLTAEQPRAS